jgi:hypothetical protein
VSLADTIKARLGRDEPEPVDLPTPDELLAMAPAQLEVVRRETDDDAWNRLREEAWKVQRRRTPKARKDAKARAEDEGMGYYAWGDQLPVEPPAGFMIVDGVVDEPRAPTLSKALEREVDRRRGIVRAKQVWREMFGADPGAVRATEVAHYEDRHPDVPSIDDEG